MSSKTVGQGMFGVGFVVLAFASGVLPWAIAIGAAAGAVSFLIRRTWQIALFWGGSTAVMVSALGIATMLSPGWYEGLF